MKKEISQFDKNLDLGIQAFVKTVFIAEWKSNALTKAGLFYQLHLTTLLGGAKLRRNFHRISLNWAQLFKGPSALKPGLNLTRVQFSFLCSKGFSQIIFCVIFRASKTKRIKTELLFKFSNLNSNLALTLDYLNPASNNSALAKS